MSVVVRVADLAARLRAAARPLPEVTVEHGPWLPGWVLRVLFPVAVPVLMLGAASRTPLDGVIVLMVTGAVTAWALARPSPEAAHTAVALAAIALLGAGQAPFDPAVLWLAPLGYLATRLAWWAQHVGLGVRVELAALAAAGARDVAVIVLTLALGGAAWTVAGRPVSGVVALGTAALAAVAWLAVRRDDGRVRDAHS